MNGLNGVAVGTVWSSAAFSAGPCCPCLSLPLMTHVIGGCLECAYFIVAQYRYDLAVSAQLTTFCYLLIFSSLPMFCYLSWASFHCFCTLSALQTLWVYASIDLFLTEYLMFTFNFLNLAVLALWKIYVHRHSGCISCRPYECLPNLFIVHLLFISIYIIFLFTFILLSVLYQNKLYL